MTQESVSAEIHLLTKRKEKLLEDVESLARSKAQTVMQNRREIQELEVQKAQLIKAVEELSKEVAILEQTKEELEKMANKETIEETVARLDEWQSSLEIREATLKNDLEEYKLNMQKLYQRAQEIDTTKRTNIS